MRTPWFYWHGLNPREDWTGEVPATLPRICWIIARDEARILLLFCLIPSQTMRGMPLRPDTVNRSMRKQRVTTPHRRPGFDALEDRRLLSTVYLGAARGEEFVLVFPGSTGFDQQPISIVPSAFPGGSPFFEGPSRWEGGGVGNNGWGTPSVAPGNGPGWFTTYPSTAPGGNPSLNTTSSSGSQSSPGSTGPNTAVPAPDPDAWPDNSMAGGPMVAAPNSTDFGNGPSTGPQPYMSLPGSSSLTLVLKVDYTATPQPTLSVTPSPTSSNSSPERGHPELNESEPTQTTTVGVLGGNTPGGPQVTTIAGTSPASTAVGNLVSPIGNAPLQPISLLDARSINAEYSASASRVTDGLLGVANSLSSHESSGRERRCELHADLPHGPPATLGLRHVLFR